MLSDGSTGWHLVNGHYILSNWGLPQQDLISYTFSDKPVVAYEWLFDAFMAGLHKIGGLRLVSLFCGSAIALLFLLIYQNCRRLGCHFLTTVLLCVIGVFVCAVHFLVRPHLVTFFAVFFYVVWLDAYKNGQLSSRRLWLYLGLTMIVWVNCHPAFIIGLVIVAIYLISELVLAVFSVASKARDKAFLRVKGLLAGIGFVGMATFINPYGFRLHQYIAEYLRQSVVIANTDEYKSPIFHGDLQSICLELLYCILLFGMAFTRAKPNLAKFILLLVFAHLSLVSMRNMPLFAIVAIPCAAKLLANFPSLFVKSDKQGIWTSARTAIMNLWRSSGRTIDAMEFACTRHALPAITVIFLAISCLNHGKAFGFQLIGSKFDPTTKPTKTLNYVLSHGFAKKHGFNFDNWGGYIRYRTGMRVFIDDRVDFYGEKFYLDYAGIVTLEPNWKVLLDKHGIEWILFPNDSVLSAALNHDKDWKQICQDQVGSLYVRVGSSVDQMENQLRLPDDLLLPKSRLTGAN